jgi:hypothetical protein
MYLIHKFDDGSFSVGYERGDRVPTSRDIIFRTLNGEPIRTYPKGSMVTIGGQWEYIERLPQYWFTFDDGHKERHHDWYLDHSGVKLDEIKPCPPTDWVIPWHEGRLWKYHRVLAWSPEEAREKLEKKINGYGDPARLDGITWKPAIKFEDFEKPDDLRWMGMIGL